MARTTARELIRAAQAAELEKDLEKAAAFLQEAARLHLEDGEKKRAASLFRHSLRLKPGQAEVEEALASLESDEPRDAEAEPKPLCLELPERGPTAADPAVASWCSFCCRPKDEVGPMVAGPAGAFICAECIRSAAVIARVDLASARAPAPGVAHPEPDAEPASEPIARPAATGRSFIEAAVLLSRSLGWSLDEVRSLSPDERDQAIAILERSGR